MNWVTPQRTATEGDLEIFPLFGARLDWKSSERRHAFSSVLPRIQMRLAKFAINFFVWIAKLSTRLSLFGQFIRSKQRTRVDRSGSYFTRRGSSGYRVASPFVLGTASHCYSARAAQLTLVASGLVCWCACMQE